ncbi:MAG: recombinase family protein, partial [Robiginitomaculum sp.]|nr:recombinase family protein [Robiginitomaculum sp.]
MKNNNSFKPAVIYARVSSKKQVTEGSGLDSQNSRCRLYAQARGYDVVATFTDDMTGSKVRRPGMDAMLAYLKQNKTMPHYVLIDDISRLARGINAHWKLRESITKAGGLLESPSIQFGDDSDSQLIENMLASTSQHFRQKNREQTISRMKTRL